MIKAAFDIVGKVYLSLFILSVLCSGQTLKSASNRNFILRGKLFMATFIVITIEWFLVLASIVPGWNCFSFSWSGGNNN